MNTNGNRCHCSKSSTRNKRFLTHLHPATIGYDFSYLPRPAQGHSRDGRGLATMNCVAILLALFIEALVFCTACCSSSIFLRRIRMHTLHYVELILTVTPLPTHLQHESSNGGSPLGSGVLGTLLPKIRGCQILICSSSGRTALTQMPGTSLWYTHCLH